MQQRVGDRPMAENMEVKEMDCMNLTRGLNRLNAKKYSFTNGFMIVRGQPYLNCADFTVMKASGWFIDEDGNWCFKLENDITTGDMPGIISKEMEKDYDNYRQ